MGPDSRARTRKGQRLSVIVCALIGCSSPRTAETGPARARPIAVVGVNLITLPDGGVREDQTVVVEDDRITQVGPAASTIAPPGSLRIDGRGKFLMPGLVDFHVHLRDSSELLSYLAHGVTSVVHLSGPTGNISDVLALRAQIAAGEVLGPTIYASGRTLDGDPPVFPAVSTAVTIPEEARRAVAEQHRAGVDFIKVYNNLTPEVHAAIVEEAHARGLAVVGHIPRKVGRPQALQTALDAGQDMIAHSEELFFTYFYGDTESRLDRGLAPEPDRSRIPWVVERLRRSGAAVTPNLSFVAMTARQLDDLDGVLGDPEARYLHPQVLQMWRDGNPRRRPDLERFTARERAKFPFLQELTRALARGGIPLLAGTDASAPGLFPGKSMHVELEELVRAGLTPAQALAAATTSASRFIQQHVRGADPFGSVEPGQRADLVLLGANPLADIRNAARITGVVVRGRWLTAEAIGSMRRAYGSR